MVDSTQEEHVTRFDEALVIVRHLRGDDDLLQAMGMSDNYRGLKAFPDAPQSILAGATPSSYIAMKGRLLNRAKLTFG